MQTTAAGVDRVRATRVPIGVSRWATSAGSAGRSGFTGGAVGAEATGFAVRACLPVGNSVAAMATRTAMAAGPAGPAGPAGTSGAPGTAGTGFAGTTGMAEDPARAAGTADQPRSPPAWPDDVPLTPLPIKARPVRASEGVFTTFRRVCATFAASVFA
ncbi:MAG: hypothetical protein K2X56_23430 [Mycobacterium pseudokansasii]|nr:hypothetical protein [Mycobacterium pseudokansasii]